MVLPYSLHGRRSFRGDMLLGVQTLVTLLILQLQLGLCWYLKNKLDEVKVDPFRYVPIMQKGERNMSEEYRHPPPTLISSSSLSGESQLILELSGVLKFLGKEPVWR